MLNKGFVLKKKIIIVLKRLKLMGKNNFTISQELLWPRGEAILTISKHKTEKSVSLLK